MAEKSNRDWAFMLAIEALKGAINIVIAKIRRKTKDDSERTSTEQQNSTESNQN